MKKAWRIISNIFVWTVVVLTVCVMIFTIVSVRTFDQNERKLFGFQAYIVLSDSMEATDFAAGDVVFVKEVDPAALQPGDVIAFVSQDPKSYGQTVTHKIKELTVLNNGDPAFITYGTTTGVEDTYPVAYPYVLGQYQFAIPKIGTFFNFLKTTQGYIVCILIPFLFLILYQGLNCIKIFRLYKKEQLAQLQAEKEEIAQQRRKNEELMAEILALKAQMEQTAQEKNKP